MALAAFKVYVVQKIEKKIMKVPAHTNIKKPACRIWTYYLRKFLYLHIGN